jgi:hypothetical protein
MLRRLSRAEGAPRAQDRGALGWVIVDRSVQPPRLTEDVIRDEQVQATYLMEVLSILDEEKVDGAFWFTEMGPCIPVA